MNEKCCAGFGMWKAIGLAVILGTFFSVGMYTGQRQLAQPQNASNLPIKLLADSAANCEKASMATGTINGDFEGLFILDHPSGQLYCIMLNPRTGAQVGFYSTNVRQALALDRQGDADFAMVTGYINLQEAGKSGTNRMANCLCYVVDGVTGRAAAFGLSYNQTGIDTSVPQQGNLVKFWDGPIRDQAFGQVPAAGIAPLKGAEGIPAGGEDPAAAGNGGQ